jgi:hypothetical protein
LANFQGTHYIHLFGATPVAESSLSWTSYNPVANGSVVTDVGSDGVLTQGSDRYVFNMTFSGFYVEVGGQHFGVFNAGTNWIIPYNNTQFDLAGVLPQVGSTSLFIETLTTAANCFLTGTRIATPEGPRAIETLGPDDRVLSADGRALPIIWVWRQEIVNIHGLSDSLAPILITANALGPGRPARDLIVSADHAMALDGILINARAMVNGTRIRAIPAAQMPARFCYWHIETMDHELLLAENCPTESYIDYTPRTRFDNIDGYMARYGQARSIPEMPLPRISAARQLLEHLREAGGARCPA